MNKICLGCGALLQNTNETNVGYVKDLNHDYCMRCFRNIHYNEVKTENLNYTNEELLKKINDSSSLTLFLVDFISLNNEIIETFKKIKTPKILIINKIDVLPKSISYEKICELITEEYKIVEKIILISSLKKKNLEQIKNIIINNKNIYITGYTNAGKSGLIKALLKKYTNVPPKLTTSVMPNTTLEFMKINFLETYFFDSPGFVFENSIWNTDIKAVLKANNPKIIKPIVLQAKENDQIMIDDKWIIKVDKPNNIIFYMNNLFTVKKVYDKTIKYENMINVKSNTDLIIKGIGFINFKKDTTLEFNIPEKYLEKRNSIFL